MMERVRITAENLDAKGAVTHRHSVSIQKSVLKPEDLWDWLPSAFRAAGHLAMGDDLEKARGE